MSRPNSVKNDKEVNAVIFNMKEQRCLLKNLHTLDAEASYSLKLIDLNNRGIKLFYRRFKDKVNKIKSHLQTDEIAHLKILDESGKMKELVKPLNITGALRIADAEKRLKLQGRDNQRVTRSAMHRKSSEAFLESPRMLRPNTCMGSLRRDSVRPKRPRSLSTGRKSPIITLSSPVAEKQLKDELSNQGISDTMKLDQAASSPVANETKMLNAPTSTNSPESQPQNTHQPSAHSVTENQSETEKLKPAFNQTAIPRVLVTPIDLSQITEGYGNSQQPEESNKNSQNEKSSNKKVTIVEDFETFRKSAVEKRCQSRGSSISRMSANAAMKAGLFSCHMHSQDQLKESAKSLSNQGDHLGNYIIDDPYEERRRMLLDIENSYANNLLERKEEFLDELDAYITMQKTVVPKNPAAGDGDPNDPLQTPKHGETSLEKLTRREMRLLREQARRLSQAEAKLRGLDLWEDKPKCRYK
ncbi:uncharacterized protein LOC133204117 [Saccostrea echinata]|uniref:uncharacterized protein LOC133204117 n=1 Tax=Saccostrea echinata TaxID=191078 RepID=UPI002A82FA15|nr:uncharacterized protein LOC133204117 [Saccostrea echinata]